MEGLHETFEEQIRHMTPVSAPADQREGVTALARALEGLSQEPELAGRCELVGTKGERIAVPESVFYVLVRVAEVMARGDGITVVPVGKELTSQQSADLLNVSRQYLVRLLDGGQIPYRRVGKHRRVRIEDLLVYKQRRDSERRKALRDLTAKSEDLGGYDELG